jgi:riboflavin transporter FmnP
LVVAVVVPVLELITHSTTGVYGLVMNMLSSVTFAMVTGLIYKYRKSFYGAIVALVSGVFAVTAVMLAANLLVTPYYMGVSVQDVAALIPKMLLPFNLLKATLNAAIVLLLYKPLSDILKKIGFLASTGKSAVEEHRSVGRSIWVTVVAILVILASFGVIYFVLK